MKIMKLILVKYSVHSLLKNKQFMTNVHNIHELIINLIQSSNFLINIILLI